MSPTQKKIFEIRTGLKLYINIIKNKINNNFFINKEISAFVNNKISDNDVESIVNFYNTVAAINNMANLSSGLFTNIPVIELISNDWIVKNKTIFNPNEPSETKYYNNLKVLSDTLCKKFSLIKTVNHWMALPKVLTLF